MWKYNLNIPCYNIRVGDIVDINDYRYDVSNIYYDIPTHLVRNCIKTYHPMIEFTRDNGSFQEGIHHPFIINNLCDGCPYFRS